VYTKENRALTKEAEIRRPWLKASPRQIVHETLSQKKKNLSQKGVGGMAQGVGPEFKP
jgi:hypothetical protein